MLRMRERSILIINQDIERNYSVEISAPKSIPLLNKLSQIKKAMQCASLFHFYFTPFSFKALFRLFKMEIPIKVATSNSAKFTQKKLALSS